MNLVRFPIMLNIKKGMNIEIDISIDISIDCFHNFQPESLLNVLHVHLNTVLENLQDQVERQKHDTLTIDGKTFRLEPSRVPLMSLTDSFNACEIQNCENPMLESIADDVVEQVSTWFHLNHTLLIF